MRILIISFSARSDGNCDEINKMIQESYTATILYFGSPSSRSIPAMDAVMSVLAKKNRAHISEIRNMR